MADSGGECAGGGASHPSVVVVVENSFRIRCYCTIVPDVGVVKCLGSRAWLPLSSWASELTLFFNGFFFGITPVEHQFRVSPAVSGQVSWNTSSDSNVSVPSRVSGVC